MDNAMSERILSGTVANCMICIPTMTTEQSGPTQSINPLHPGDPPSSPRKQTPAGCLSLYLAHLTHSPPIYPSQPPLSLTQPSERHPTNPPTTQRAHPATTQRTHSATARLAGLAHPSNNSKPARPVSIRRSRREHRVERGGPARLLSANIELLRPLMHRGYPRVWGCVFGIDDARVRR
ncbi:uncharacterized protein IWZ02DRAFT_100084 [Phyllosticta citriasiana]|uniref:uncharacterized protein n=1 Tax=Phyllosticta citriasiana TaxID=595635 RepID=UPI0030FD75C5